MSPVIKQAQHRGKAPILSTLAAYLAAEEGREDCLLLDASGRALTPEEVVQQFRGEHAEHWHAIVSPTFEDCATLTERHGGDRQAAAIAQGKAIAQRLERDTGHRVVCAIHFEHREGKSHWHYHLVGEGKARARLYGRSGVIQRAWDRAWSPDRKPIQNWPEHRAFLQVREELRAVQKEMRNLGEERRKAIAAAPPEEKGTVREGFRGRELELVERRYQIEVRAIDHRYAARNDLGSPRHQAELVDAQNRRTGAITRVHHRGMPREVVWGGREGLRLAQAAKTATLSVRGTLRAAEGVLTVNGQATPRSPPVPVVQVNELAVSAARAALTATGRAAVSLAQKAVCANPPGLAVQAAKLAVNAPQKLLDLAVPDRGHLPKELDLPLRTAEAVPGIGVAAKVARLVTQETLKPILKKEVER